MTEAPQPNTAEARGPTGELMDQSQTQPNDPSLSTSTETGPQSTKTDGSTTQTPTTTEPKPADPKAPSGPPEKYEFKAPEGYELNEAVVAEASTLFKELGLTNEQGQKLVDFNAKLAQHASDAPYAAYDAMREEWQAKVKADPELGPKLPQVKETIGRALDTLGDQALVDEFRLAMNNTGAGDNPAFIKAFYKLAQAVVEGRPVAAVGPSAHGQTSKGVAERPSAASAMYPNLPS